MSSSHVDRKAPIPPRSLFGRLRLLGPGMMVAGAFVGTGTITTSIVAGTEHGYQLLWASVTFAVVLVIVLQEMVARLALASGSTLAQLVRSKLGVWMSIIAVLAIFGGNVVYSVGNLNGVSLATSGFPGSLPPLFWVTVVTLIYWLLLMIGKFAILEKTVTALVVLMSLVFLVDMVITRPDYGAVAQGLIVPQFSPSQVLLVTGLIGTTVVPYNLFLHSSALLEKRWHLDPKGFKPVAQMDTIIPVFIGGIVTMAIGVVAATVLNPQFLAGSLSIEDATDMSIALEPILGPMAYVFFNIGLFAAAVSSMPMAAISAAYVTTESFNLSTDIRATGFRTIFSTVAWAPVLIFAFLATPPVTTIIAAQSINGVLLPITAIFILILVNRRSIMGDMRNRWWINILAVLAVLFVTVLGVINVLRAFQII
ncbi:Nramp family divalent metal transporter [uncultured Brevibacterium sp.]|uniref:Nramp family divalent metal transporter n=1 Tax=uncultured Brevibacterium sp. TaxID=189678 RepID=UPI0025E04125|nr:Nramp family divalent metal transporter [uncultured Brevibacterium sp.]